MKRILIAAAAFALATSLTAPLMAAPANEGDYLVKFKQASSGPTSRFKINFLGMLPAGTKAQDLGLGWTRLQVPTRRGKSLMSLSQLNTLPGVEYVQPNYKIKLLEAPNLAALRQTALEAQKLEDGLPGMPGEAPPADNPEIPAPSNPSAGSDPLLNSQWGMLDIGVQRAWNKSKGRNNVVVAVIDTGVDYTHEDLVDNMWRNAGEVGTDSQGRDKAKNGIDDDRNGFIDDVVGWDFVSNDNKPFDFKLSDIDIILQGGNPGHGTHCAGNVAARGFNGKGVSGVAPNVSIMAIRFLSEKGQGTTAGAIQSINYALTNGAHITSNSWGSEGEDPSEDAENRALREIIALSQQKGVLFIAAAGNGHQGMGYNNDTDAQPGYPASYDHDIIISVAALDASNQLGSFSNWGVRSVDIGAPGVKVFSTTVGSKYSDTVVNFFGQQITWDGTSMATPHVAGAAALYLSHNPTASWSQIKQAILSSATAIPSMQGKAVSNGKLNVEALLDK